MSDITTKDQHATSEPLDGEQHAPTAPAAPQAPDAETGAEPKGGGTTPQDDQHATSEPLARGARVARPDGRQEDEFPVPAPQDDQHATSEPLSTKDQHATSEPADGAEPPLTPQDQHATGGGAG